MLKRDLWYSEPEFFKAVMKELEPKQSLESLEIEYAHREFQWLPLIFFSAISPWDFLDGF